ncbi:type IV pilus biogenesis/stability protein PilW [Colwellia sp. M166]|uniref:type IV pilus biogenesis/stability protein PilW n=1 Tax=Colwellia sp. M166 TaxID=2583805 RepID=UPI00211DD83D|nr:type IV pilus biogenesis/stability protein PilW [Colwellia sp. M166]UUO24564.1 type IV pilus biogenesis/stability protein PilW [Colwellia sp. M166]|tara:strand:+ start:2029 stop:3228 length:1200 start_codon:yes stop_codon:yes gene_type:complete
MMAKLSTIFIVLLSTMSLTACVTQNYGHDKSTPLIENEASNNEIAMTRISLGLGYLKMGNTQQAKLNLAKAKRFAPNLVQVHTAFAHYYETVGEADLAIEAFEHALSLNSDDADTLNNYGVFLCRQEKYAAAEQQILKAIAIPSYILVAQSYENLALCQLKAKQFNKAEIYLEKAIAHSPNSASSLYQMMRLQYAKSNYTSAQSYLYRYEKSTRRFSAEALALAFKIFTKQGNKAIAENYGNMLVKMFPHSFEAKQYILNELYRLDADKLAEQYRDSLANGKKTTKKKRVVVLSPKVVAISEKSDLSSQGLKPMMVNSVMPTVKQKLESQEKIARENNKPTMVSLPIHTVEQGDSLFTVAKQHNIAVNRLKRWNKLRSPYILKIGDVLYLADPKLAAKH